MFTPKRKEHNPMIFNVAQLMKSLVGTSLEASIDEAEIQFDEDLKVIGPLSGHVRMRRINPGLLVDGWVDLTLELTCTRCLKVFEQPMHVSFEERFQPTVDVITGTPLPAIDEDDVFPIDDHHQIDLTEALRQQILLDIPIVTLCQDDCKGLCAQCGKDLNLGPCSCTPEVDSRLSILKTLLQQHQDEEEPIHEPHE
jgi:uncharacterized protein